MVRARQGREPVFYQVLHMGFEEPVEFSTKTKKSGEVLQSHLGVACLGEGIPALNCLIAECERPRLPFEVRMTCDASAKQVLRSAGSTCNVCK